jgi:uncharacterized protein (DUF2267 family)
MHHATLITLVGRLAGLDPAAAASQLPQDFEDLIEAAGIGRRRAMTQDDVIARVAGLEGTTAEEAERHAHAVFQALREALSPKEFSDVASQLSEDYAPLLVYRERAIECPAPARS